MRSHPIQTLASPHTNLNPSPRLTTYSWWEVSPKFPESWVRATENTGGDTRQWAAARTGIDEGIGGGTEQQFHLLEARYLADWWLTMPEAYVGPSDYCVL